MSINDLFNLKNSLSKFVKYLGKSDMTYCTYDVISVMILIDDILENLIDDILENLYKEANDIQ